MALSITINGRSQAFSDLSSPTMLAEVVLTLALKADRIAVEHNGEIAPRTAWSETKINSGDRLEVVHFVGGGCSR